MFRGPTGPRGGRRQESCGSRRSLSVSNTVLRKKSLRFYYGYLSKEGSPEVSRDLVVLTGTACESVRSSTLHLEVASEVPFTRAQKPL